MHVVAGILMTLAAFWLSKWAQGNLPYFGLFNPAALEGRDGFSYSIEILSDSTDDPVEPFGAYLMFVQWARLGAQKVEGHVESDFLAWGATAEHAEGLLGAMTLAAAQKELDALLRARDGDSTRRWWGAVETTDADNGTH